MAIPVIDAVLVPTLALASPINSDISNVSSGDIKTVSTGTLTIIDDVRVPTVALASPLTSDISNVSIGDIKTVSSGTLTITDLIKVPALTLSAPLSVYIRTSNDNITLDSNSNISSSSASVQSWYFS